MSSNCGGINFSHGVMVKSYLGFGMTHIREQALQGALGWLRRWSTEKRAN